MKTIATLLLLLASIHLMAQDMEVPLIKSVTVDPATGKPLIQWQMASPSQADGYIIKRLIVDGEGVISGTFNNVSIVEGGNTFSYIDLSTAYSTEATPNGRREYYCVSSYRKMDGHTYYSLMSEPASTIMIVGSYSQCSNNYSIQCSRIANAREYVLKTPDGKQLMRGADTSFVITFPSYEHERRFVVECILADGTIYGSPVAIIPAEASNPPDVISINSVSALEEGGIGVAVSLSPSSNTERAFLLRRVEYNPSDTLELSAKSFLNFIIKDSAANADKPAFYTLVVLDGCGDVLAKSAEVSNILLSVSDNGSGCHLLSWTNPGFLIDIESAAIYISEDGSPLEFLCNVAAGEYEYAVEIPMEAASPRNGLFSYRVVYHVADPGIDACSNIASVFMEPVVDIPNALNPKSEMDDNRFFRPRADFLADYCMSIFDKRGALIFRTHTISEGWDGRFNSRLCPRDTYVYVITYTTSSGKKCEKKGYVNLVW